MRPRGLRPAHDYSEFAEDDPEVVAARADVTAYANLIEGLVELRHRRRMTQTDVAEVMGTTQSVVSHFERLAWRRCGVSDRSSTSCWSTDAEYSRWQVCRIGAGWAVSVEFAVHGGHDLAQVPAEPDERGPAIAERVRDRDLRVAVPLGQ